MLLVVSILCCVVVVGGGLLGAVHVLLRSAHPLLVTDDDEDVDDIIDLGVSGGGGLEDMADYAHAIVVRRCAVIMRNVSCDAPSAEAAMAWPDLMPMFQLMTEHISTMVHAADSIEHGQLAVRVRRRRLCMVVNRGVCVCARALFCVLTPLFCKLPPAGS